MSIDLRVSPKTPDGRARVAVEKSSTDKVQFYSHDWCDCTTWYEKAVRVVAEVLVDSGDHLTYNFDANCLIDTYHGKITGEDFIVDAEANSFRAVVTVDAVAKTEQDPHLGTGGDYTVNYLTGSLTFLSAQSPSAVVRATYHKAGSSLFTIKPSAGKCLTIEMVEVQISDNVELADSTTFQAYGLVDVFAPFLMPGVPSGTLIPLGNPIVYKTMRDFMNDAQRSYVAYPPLGGSGWRGLSNPTYVLDWDYLRGTRLLSAAGMEIRVVLEHDTPHLGALATATFYCSSEDE